MFQTLLLCVHNGFSFIGNIVQFLTLSRIHMVGKMSDRGQLELTTYRDFGRPVRDKLFRLVSILLV